MSQVRSGGRLAVVAWALLLGGTACAGESPAPVPIPPAPTATASATASPTATTAASPSPSGPATTAPTRRPSVPGSPSPGATGASRTPTGRTPTGPPPATTPVPPSAPGGVDQTVSAAPETSRPPVDLDRSAEADNGVSITIPRARAVRATAQLPGEVAGPAVALTVSVENTSNRPVDLGTTVVTVLDSRGNPGGEISTSPAKPLRGRLAPGASASGTYVFTVPENRRDPITVSVTLSGEVPVVVFRGEVS